VSITELLLLVLHYVKFNENLRVGVKLNYCKLQQEEALIESFGRLQDRLEAQEVKREAERQEHRRQLEQMNKEWEADREALRQAMLMLQSSPTASFSTKGNINNIYVLIVY